MGSTAEIITSLNSAREIVLHDAGIYPQVVPGVLPVIGAAAHVGLRRWGADFLAETFASPVLAADVKQSMCPAILDTLMSYLNRKEEFGEDEDASVVRSAVQCAASIYSLVFRSTIAVPPDSEPWSKMARIKSSILRRMDTAPAGVRICCIKFVSRVVQVQTSGMIADPRRPEQNEISLALVPRDHPLMTPSNLEAEASGLLDRLLGVLQDNLSDAVIVTATLNALAALVQRRPSIAPKILATVLNFNPLVLANGPMSGKDRVAVRSMTRTTMSFLINTLKRNPSSPMAGRLQQTIERLRQCLDEAFSDRVKRPAPEEPNDGLDEVKRRKIEEAATNGADSPATNGYDYPLPTTGPVSLAQLFTLSRDPAATSFHVEAIPLDIVNRLIPPLLQHIDAGKLDAAINAVRRRYLELSRRPPASAIETAKDFVGDDDDDDYDPSAEFPDSEQVQNVLDHVDGNIVSNDVALGPFDLPVPPPITEREKDEYSRTALVRVFGTLSELDRSARLKATKAPDNVRGFGRTAASAQDREGWVTLLTRLATRTLYEEGEQNGVKKVEDENQALTKKSQGFDLAGGIRQALMNYILEDFRRRIDVAIAWLNEEWYSDRLRLRERDYDVSDSTSEGDHLPHYWSCMLRVLDAMVPYLDIKDAKTLIRFLSEIPQLNHAVMDRLRMLASDPDKVQLTTQTLLYLSMFRPPVREMVLDTVEELWRTNSDAKSSAAKILTRWRPGVLQSGTPLVKVEA